VDVRDEQGGVGVEDVEDLKADGGLVVAEVRNIAGAVHLEPELRARVLLGAPDDAERVGDGQVAAQLRLAGRRERRCQERGDDDEDEEKNMAARGRAMAT
jgi:hypothetical protein